MVNEGPSAARRTALRLRLIIDLRDAVLAVAAAHLDDDVDREEEKVADVRAGELASFHRLLHEKRELLEGESRRESAWTVVIEPGWPELTLRK